MRPFTMGETGYILGVGLGTGVLVLLLGACGGQAPMVENLPEIVDFNFHVKPILSDRCFACHGPDDRARKAGLRLDTREGLFASPDSGRRPVVSGRPGRSELVRRILSTDPRVIMPLPESHLTLSEYEKALLVRWVEQGAPWRPHWAFIPPSVPTPPNVRDEGWIRQAIDRFVLEGLERRGITPAGETTRETWLRRVSFDLTGLPPTLEEIDTFLEDDSPDAYEKVVDRLLASPAYGERMAVEWLDVARYADSHGYQDDGMRAMWPWRDWVIEAFNRNMPFDRFVTWQLAGDLLPNPTREQLVATAFNRNHMQSQEGGIVEEEYRVEYVADRVDTLGKAFLGVSLECARCHDHKYDPVLQTEYFRLFSFFNSVDESGQAPYSGMPSPTVILKDEAARARLGDLREEIRSIEDQVRADHPSFDRGFGAWLARLERASGPVMEREPPGLIGHLPLDRIRDLEFENLADRRHPGRLGGDRDRVPVTVPGKIGGGLRLVGESHIEMPREFGFFERNQPFSVGIWFRIEEPGTAGPLFSRSGGSANGYRGYEVMLREDGTIRAGLHHVAPGNSLEVETADPVVGGAWRHLVLTYDGSGRASGLRLFIDGRAARTRTRADNLRRSIVRSGIPDNQNWGTPAGLRIGRRGDETLDHVSVDDFRVYDRRLTALEVEQLSGGEDPFRRLVPLAAVGEPTSPPSAVREHYVHRHDREFARRFERLTELRGRESELLTDLPELMIMRDLPEPRPTFVLDRGAYDAPTERVEPGTPASILPFPDALPKDRLGLARWLLDPAHPLTARVIVNRYWALFFGRGIVPTPEDFGSQGRLPTHPELLDSLATTFVKSGWDLKALHRSIVLSATYRQSSIVDAERLEEDPENEWLARGPSHRLLAEQIRDGALAASGLLVRRIGGPSVYPYQPPGLWEELATRNATTYSQGEGEDLYRRSLYTVWKRSSPPPSAIGFDSSERLLCAVSRQRTSTPLQALVLLNDPQYVEAARLLAERMVREGGLETGARISLGFRLALGRRPFPEELALLEELYHENRARFEVDPEAALGLLSVGDYPRDARLDPAETAALAVVAGTILNLDEAVNKR
jgi:hypothetical protein